MNKRIASAILMLMLLFSAFPLQALAAAAQVQQVQVVASVNFRNEPSTSGARIRYLQPGESLELVTKVNASWLKAKDKNGVIGYVSSSSEYVKLQTVTVAPASNGKIISSVSFRQGPSTDSTRIRYLQTGEAIMVLEKVNAYWYKITDKNGVTGYISTDEKYVSTTFTPPAPPTLDPAVAAQKVIAAGMKYLGTPYEFGSDRSTTTTFDCSDLVRQEFMDALKLKLPADSRGQGQYVKDHNPTTANWQNLKPGDLLFFMDYKGSKASDYANVNKATATISHVALYLGDGKILHTYSISSGGVRVDSITSSAWQYRFLFGGSVL